MKFRQVLFFDKGGEDCAKALDAVASAVCKIILPKIRFLNAKIDCEKVIPQNCSLMVLGDKSVVETTIRNGIVDSAGICIFAIDHIKGLQRAYSDTVVAFVNDSDSILLVPTEHHAERYASFGFIRSRLVVVGSPAIGLNVKRWGKPREKKLPSCLILCDEMLHDHYEGESCAHCDGWVRSDLGDAVLQALSANNLLSKLPVLVRYHPRDRVRSGGKHHDKLIDISDVPEEVVMNMGGVFVGFLSMIFLKARANEIPTLNILDYEVSNRFRGYGLDAQLLSSAASGFDSRIAIRELTTMLIDRSVSVFQNFDASE